MQRAAEMGIACLQRAVRLQIARGEVIQHNDAGGSFVLTRDRFARDCGIDGLGDRAKARNQRLELLNEGIAAARRGRAGDHDSLASLLPH